MVHASRVRAHVVHDRTGRACLRITRLRTVCLFLRFQRFVLTRPFYCFTLYCFTLCCFAFCCFAFC